MKKSKFLFLLLIGSMSLGACSPSNKDSISDNNSTTTESVPSDSNENSESHSETISSESLSESEESQESESLSESKESESHSETDNSIYYNQPNPKAQKVTIKTLTNKGNQSDSKNLYSITGTVQYPYNTTYGNFDLVDETGSITVWGLSINASTMTYSGSTYTYNNDTTFTAINLKAGDIITMEGVYVAYSMSPNYYKPEISGYIIKKTPGNVFPINGKNYTANEPYSGNYYSGVENLSGNNLLKGLHNLMMTTHTNYVTYSSLKTTLKESDPGSRSSEVRCFYSGKSTTSFNREHVWCQSLSGSSSSSSTNLYGESYGGSDIHHIRPAIGSYNSLRSNASFGVTYGPKSGMKTISHENGGYNYITGNVIEPVDEIKGDVARIVMYMYMHYSSSIANDGSKYSFLGAMNIYFIMAPSRSSDCFKMLRDWNAIDPVDDYERNRNEVAFRKQGNRNPFIDHPSYADKIWG